MSMAKLGHYPASSLSQKKDQACQQSSQAPQNCSCSTPHQYQCCQALRSQPYRDKEWADC